MKVLMVHNFYGSSAPSGENQVFLGESALLKKHGHDIRQFTRHSDEILSKGVLGNITGALSTPWNPWTVYAARREVDAFRPDVVHVHNTFPLLSPSIFYGIRSSAPRLLTLHNYRLFCSAAIPLRAGKTCTECLDQRSAWPALKHSCYRKNRAATVPLAISVALHRRIGTWMREVDGFIALTEFQRDLMIEAGLPADRMHVKPNYYAGYPTPIDWDRRQRSVVFAGRLSEEKGLEALISAWMLWGPEAPELQIAGDGPLQAEIRRKVASRPDVPIRLLGQLTSGEAQRHVARARLLIVPSEWFEGFPMVIVEAFAHGTPVAVTNVGPLPAIVKHGVSGLVFQPRNPESLFQTIRDAWSVPGYLERLSIGAVRSFERSYTESANYETLMSIYEDAIAAYRSRTAE